MKRLLLSVFVFSILSLIACNSCEAKGVKSKRKLAKRVKVDRTKGETVVNDSVTVVADDNITPKDIPHEGFVYVKDYIPETLGGRNAGLSACLGLFYAYKDRQPITGCCTTRELLPNTTPTASTPAFCCLPPTVQTASD